MRSRRRRSSGLVAAPPWPQTERLWRDRGGGPARESRRRGPGAGRRIVRGGIAADRTRIGRSRGDAAARSGPGADQERARGGSGAGQGRVGDRTHPQVELRDEASVWYGAVIRGDHAAVTIGSTANVQSRAVVETVPELESGFPAAVSVGDYSSVGAGATLRSCTIEHSVDVGAGSCVLEGALVQAGVILEPGTVVPPGALVPAGEKWGGRPERGSASNFRRNFDGVFWLRRGYGTDGRGAAAAATWIFRGVWVGSASDRPRRSDTRGRKRGYSAEASRGGRSFTGISSRLVPAQAATRPRSSPSCPPRRPAPSWSAPRRSASSPTLRATSTTRRRARPEYHTRELPDGARTTRVGYLNISLEYISFSTDRHPCIFESQLSGVT